MAEMSELVRDMLDWLEFRYEKHTSTLPARPASTGLRRLDQLTGGPGPGGWLIRSAPGLGATSLLVAFMHDVLLRPQPQVVQLLTTDMSPRELTLRFFARLAGIPVDRLYRGDVREEEWARLAFAARVLGTPDVRVTDARGWSQGELELWCAEQHPANHHPQVSWLVIDGIDRISERGVVSLPRLERLSGRYVVATTANLREPRSAAALVTTLRVDGAGRLLLHVDRTPSRTHEGAAVGLSVNPGTFHTSEARGPDGGDVAPASPG